MVNPLSLLGRLGYGNTANRAQLLQRCFGIHTLAGEKTGGNQARASDSLPAMQHDVFTR